VTQLLGKRWSPEQVAHELRERFADQPGRRLCAESIYQAIYDPDVPVVRPAKRSRRRRPSDRRNAAAADVVGAGSRAWSGAGG
jgi:IS30 family transposase